MLKTHVLSALALAILAACATTTAATGEKITKTELADATKPPSADECGARAQQALVGKNRSEIPATLTGARIACTTCAVTMDYRPDRLNIFFDEKTQVIKEVKCG